MDQSIASAMAELPRAGNSMPLYRQVTEAIARQIEEGSLQPGSLLAPEVELAHQLGVSRFTVRAGIDELVRAGLLERHRGKGTFVTVPRIQQSLARFYSVAHEMRARGASLETQVLSRGRLYVGHPLAATASERLGLEAPADIGYLERLRLVDGTPLLLEWIMFPAEVCPALLAAPLVGAGDPAAASFYDELAKRAGVVVSQAHETLRPELVTGHDARLLKVRSGSPVFLVERVSTAGERIVEWRRAFVRGDRYGYSVDLVNPVDEEDGSDVDTSA